LGDDWKERLAIIVATMREMSAQTDPQEMVANYARRMQQLLPRERLIALSRRGLDPPYYRITRYSGWEESINPWKEKDRLPLLAGGVLGELLYSGSPQIIEELEVTEDDPAAEFLKGQRSLVAIPQYDRGVVLNMSVLTLAEPGGFQAEELPELVWLTNLFGRATHNLVLSEELRSAYEAVDRQIRQVAAIQRSLLPAELPEIPRLMLATHYQASERASGDYYDFFELPDGRWGLLIADVSGHGTPAAVMMAIVHSIVHTYPDAPTCASDLLGYINRQLCEHYTGQSGSFVTAFYGIYNPTNRSLNYSNAGHCLPLLKHCEAGLVSEIGGARNLPLGILAEETYANRSHYFSPGDQLVLYTDGISESVNPQGEMFGARRLDQVLTRCRHDADEIISALLENLKKFTHNAPADDDRTVVVAKVI